MNRAMRAGLTQTGMQQEAFEADRRLGLCVLVQRDAGGGRSIENHQELLDALNGMPSVCYRRWQVVSPVAGGGGESMRRVAQIFAAAKVIVAPHGGTLSNLLFSVGIPMAGDSEGIGAPNSPAPARAMPFPSKTHVLELMPACRPNLCYERLCRALGMPYLGMVVPDSSYTQAMHVDVVRVLMSLQRLLHHV